MGEWGIISRRVMPIAKAIPRKTSVLRAEVLPTLRKHGSLSSAVKPSQEDALHHCLESGYDLIHQASPAPTRSVGITQ